MNDPELNYRTLRRFAALLVALAVLADRAGSRSFPVRWYVLVILRHAERVAVGYVVRTTRLDWPDLDYDPTSGNSPADAACLAVRLRLLAAILGALLPPESLYGREIPGSATVLRRLRWCVGAGHGTPRDLAFLAPDTS